MGREESVIVADTAWLRLLYRDAVERHPELRDCLRSGALRAAVSRAEREGLPSRSRDMFVRLVGDALDSVDAGMD